MTQNARTALESTVPMQVSHVAGGKSKFEYFYSGKRTIKASCQWTRPLSAFERHANIHPQQLEAFAEEEQKLGGISAEETQKGTCLRGQNGWSSS